jgi:hypothetical protein
VESSREGEPMSDHERGLLVLLCVVIGICLAVWVGAV